MKKKSVFAIIVFAIYAGVMIWEVFVGPYRSFGGVRKYNFYPLKTILGFLKYHQYYNFEVLFINLIGNIVTFLPLGFFLPLLFESIDSARKLLTMSVIIIVSVEIIQFLLNVGVCDIDDVILNSLGCLLGYLLFKIYMKLVRKWKVCKI